MKTTEHFTPALGRDDLTRDYDRVIAVMTRERKWRPRLLSSMSLHAGQVIVDLGSGTGSLAVMVKRAHPQVTVIAVDPDPVARSIAEAKAKVAGVQIEFQTALGGTLHEGLPYERVDAVVTSLVLHQCSQDAKIALLANAYAVLRPNGTLFVADYGLQRTILMQILFNQVRSLDGYENTKANKDGLIPVLISETGFVEVAERWTVATPSGEIALWTGTKPG